MEAHNARTEVRNAGQMDNASTETSEPTAPRPLADILADLQKPIPQRLLETRRQGGQEITYVPWYRAQKIFNHYCRGFWEYRIVDRWQQDASDFMITVEITVHAAEGSFRRQGTGREEPNVSGYGDVQSNAESMAFRRAAAKWGLGLDLYEDDA